MLALAAGGQPPGDGQVSLARSGAAQQTAVAALLDPSPAGQLKNLRLRESRHGGEVKGVQIFQQGKAGLLDARLQSVSAARCELQLRQPQEVLEIILITGGCFA